MTGRASYAAAFVTENLGLASDAISPERLPPRLVDSIESGLMKPEPGGYDQPFVEQELRAFSEALERKELEEEGLSVRKARWPGAASFAICLTHDVDNVSRPLGHVWKVRARFKPSEVTLAMLKVRSLYNNMELIAEREAAHGFRSSFYLMSAEYPLEPLKRTADVLVSRGCEIGLHGDFGTHDSLEKMKGAAAKLTEVFGIVPKGVREHYLRFDFSKTWRIMEESGFDYDTTLGMADKVGFKLGITTPFHPPNEDWSAMNLLELPLVLMDTTLWGYLKKRETDGYRDTLAMMEKVQAVGGLFTLLWHQEAVRMKGGRVYWRLLDEFARAGAYVGSGLEVSTWWRGRAALPLLRRGKQFTLGGTPPRGLVLQVRTRDGMRIRAEAAAVKEHGEGFYSVTPEDPSFTMELV